MNLYHRKIYNDRPTFKCNLGEIRAGGLLFYRIKEKEKEKEYLVIEENDRYSDLGGKTEMNDVDIFDTISREVEEESNGLFKKEEIKAYILSRVYECIYYKTGKYLLYILPIDNFIKKEYPGLKWINLKEFEEKHHLRLLPISNISII